VKFGLPPEALALGFKKTTENFELAGHKTFRIKTDFSSAKTTSHKNEEQVFSESSEVFSSCLMENTLHVCYKILSQFWGDYTQGLDW
jgi:hypothetical protein